MKQVYKSSHLFITNWLSKLNLNFKQLRVMDFGLLPSKILEIFVCGAEKGRNLTFF